MLGGRGMGGGNGTSGGMLRVVGRAAARAGVASGGLQPETVSSSKTTNSTSRPSQKSKSSNHLSLVASTSTFASHNVPLSGLPSKQAMYWCDEDEWVAVDEWEDDRVNGFVDDSNLWSVPSKDEVEDAVFALKNFHPATYSQFVRDKYNHSWGQDVSDQLKSPCLLTEVSSDGSEVDWKEPSLHLCNPRASSPHGPERVYDAFHLLRTEPSIQKMVKSLSSDEAVWTAVLNNEAVRELKESFYAEKLKSSQGSAETSENESDNDSNQATNFLIWAFDNTKTKVMEAIEKVTKFVLELFGDHNHNRSGPDANHDAFEEKLRTSFLLSILVLLVVVVSRAQA